MSDANIYLGSRGDDFRELITELLRRGNLKPKYIEQLTSKKAMQAFGVAFTAASADPVNNYERFEQIGDVTANKFIVWYAYRRFPQLDCTAGVKVVARLRINYGAKATFAQIADDLGFWDYISCAIDGDQRNVKYRNRHKKDLLEDVFEAFVGCTEYLLDKAYMPGVGYGIVYNILSSIFDDISISLRYDDLFDAKTRLKETFDLFADLGEWAFINRRTEPNEDGHTMSESSLYIVPVGESKMPIREKYGPGKRDFTEKPRRGWKRIGSALAPKKSDAEQLAAEQGLQYLKSKGYYRHPPKEYQLFCN